MQTQNKHYYQITLGKRYQISALRQAGHSLRIIGEMVGIHYSEVSRELRRNTDNDRYEPDIAQALFTSQRHLKPVSGTKKQIKSLRML